jgi:hypothetical protein
MRCAVADARDHVMRTVLAGGREAGAPVHITVDD